GWGGGGEAGWDDAGRGRGCPAGWTVHGREAMIPAGSTASTPCSRRSPALSGWARCGRRGAYSRKESAMKFGYFTLTDTPAGYGPARRSPNQFLQEVIEEALYAEELGYNSVWLPEHHFALFGCLPTPAQYLAYIA